MWPVPVVVVNEHFNNPLKVVMVQNQQPVETFRADRAHEPLGDAVGLWRSTWRTNDLNAFASEHLIEPLGQFLIPVANKKPQRLRALGHRPRQLPRLLDVPGYARVRRATGGMNTSAAQLDEEDDIETYMDSSPWS